MTTPDLNALFFASVARMGGAASYFDRTIAPVVDSILSDARSGFDDPQKRDATFLRIVEVPFCAALALDNLQEPTPGSADWPSMAVARFWAAYLEGRRQGDPFGGLEAFTREHKIALVQNLNMLGVSKDIAVEMVVGLPYKAPQCPSAGAWEQTKDPLALAGSLAIAVADARAAAIGVMRDFFHRAESRIDLDAAQAWAGAVRLALAEPKKSEGGGQPVRGARSAALPDLARLSALSAVDERLVLWVADANVAAASSPQNRQSLQIDLAGRLLQLRAEFGSDLDFCAAASLAARHCAVCQDTWDADSRRALPKPGKRAKDCVDALASTQSAFAGFVVNAIQARSETVAGSSMSVADMDRAAALAWLVGQQEIGGPNPSMNPEGSMSDPGAEARKAYYYGAGSPSGQPSRALAPRQREFLQAFREAWLDNRLARKMRARELGERALSFSPALGRAISAATDAAERGSWALPLAANPQAALDFLSTRASAARAEALASGRDAQETFLPPLSAPIAFALARMIREAGGVAVSAPNFLPEGFASEATRLLSESAWPAQLASSAQKDEIRAEFDALHSSSRAAALAWLAPQSAYTGPSVSLLEEALAFVAAAARSGAGSECAQLWAEKCEMGVARAEQAQLARLIAELKPLAAAEGGLESGASQRQPTQSSQGGASRRL